LRRPKFIPEIGEAAAPPHSPDAGDDRVPREGDVRVVTGDRQGDYSSGHDFGQAPLEGADEGLRGYRKAILTGGIALVLGVGSLLYVVNEQKNSYDFTTSTRTFVRDALTDSVPVAPLDEFFSRERMEAYYRGEGLRITFKINNDPRKGYQETTETCEIRSEPDFDMNKPTRRALVDSQRDAVIECMKRFQTIIPRTVPANILVDVTEGVTPQLDTILKKAIREQEFSRHLESQRDTVMLMVSKIFDAKYTNSERWIILPGTSQNGINETLEAAREWALIPDSEKRSSSVSTGLFNGFKLRQQHDLRGGWVLVVSDGMQLARNRSASDAVNFYEVLRNPAYLDSRRWPAIDRAILEEWGGDCPPLHGARVVWYAPASNLPIPKVMAYWEHLLTTRCGALNFEFFF